MSVDAKLIVVCDPTDQLYVAKKVLEALNVWQRKQLDTAVKSLGYNRFQLILEDKTKWTNGVTPTTTDFSSFTYHFIINGESRMLWMHLDCDCDYSEVYDGYKIIFSIGHWGNYNAIMREVALACAGFGDVYYDHNDCDDLDFVQVFDFAENSSQFKE